MRPARRIFARDGWVRVVGCIALLHLVCLAGDVLAQTGGARRTEVVTIGPALRLADASSASEASRAIDILPSPIEPVSDESVRAAMSEFSPTLAKLLEQLAEASSSGVSTWSRQLQGLLAQLHATIEEGGGSPVGVLPRIEAKLREADLLIARSTDYSDICAIQRARLAVERRMPVWRAVAVAESRNTAPRALAANPFPATGAALGGASPADDDAPDEPVTFDVRLDTLLDGVEGLTGTSGEGMRWRNYLQVEKLRMVAKAVRASSLDRAMSDPRGRLPVVQTLARLRSPRLTAPQIAFLQSEPIAALERFLLTSYTPQVTAQSLLDEVEVFEASANDRSAQSLAASLLELQMSSLPEDRQLGFQLHESYCNANVRFALSERLLNRLVPERPTEYAPVNDRIDGKPVAGHRWTNTQVAFLLSPHPRHLAVTLDVQGTVSASTSSSNFAATFFNQSDSSYHGSKLITFDTQGIHASPARVDVDNRMRLRDVQTSLDIIPLIGDLAGEVAKSEFDGARPRISREVRSKVHHEAKQQIDSEADARFGVMNQRLNARFFEPLRAMGLGPAMLENRTTEDELIARWRLSTEGQLGGFTPRPHPPTGSLASCQVHESAINNMLEGLGLHGKTFTMPELKAYVAERLNRPEWVSDANGEQADEAVEITFAPLDPVRIRFDEGVIRLTLSIHRLQRGRQRWDRFKVLVAYRPGVNGLTTWLMRDGVVDLADAGGISKQLALRGIFSGVFVEGQPIRLTPDAMARDARLQGLYVNQFHLEDGWLALSLGEYAAPQRMADRSSSR